MKLIPAISIKNNHVAIVENGQYTFLRNSEGKYRDPVNLIRELELADEEVFILDIDGLEKNNPNLDTLKRIAAYKDVWVDAGTTDSDSMMDIFISGASRVVMGTHSICSLNELWKALDISENIIFSIAYDKGIVSPDKCVSAMDLDTLFNEIGERPIQTGMLFDLGGLRDKTSLDLGIVSKLTGRFKELYVSGIVPEENYNALEISGVNGLIMDFRALGAMKHE